MKIFEQIKGERFQLLKKDTKKAKELFNNYYKGVYDIFEAYERPSREKIKLFLKWRNYLNSIGFDAVVCTFNKFIFTIGGINESGQLMYITPSNKYIIK